MNKIRKLRSEKGLSIRELAIQAGVGSATVMRLEQDGKAYSQTLAKLAKFFNISLEELEGFEAVHPKSGGLALTK